MVNALLQKEFLEYDIVSNHVGSPDERPNLFMHAIPRFAKWPHPDSPDHYKIMEAESDHLRCHIARIHFYPSLMLVQQSISSLFFIMSGSAGPFKQGASCRHGFRRINYKCCIGTNYAIFTSLEYGD